MHTLGLIYDYNYVEKPLLLSIGNFHTNSSPGSNEVCLLAGFAMSSCVNS